MVASTLGATAFQKGLGAMHSLTHAAGGALNTGHGQTISVVMPYVALFNKVREAPVRSCLHLTPSCLVLSAWLCSRLCWERALTLRTPRTHAHHCSLRLKTSSAT